MNWKTLIESIKATGMSQAEIARYVGVSAAVISGLALGKQHEVGWANGQRLIVLALQRDCL